MSSTQESGQTMPDPPSPTPPSTSAPGDIPVAAAEPTTPTLPSIPTVITIVAWVVTGGLALLALGRLVHLDDAIDWPYTVVNALTPLLYLPAYAAVAVAFARRRNLLLIVSVALIAVHAFWTVPELLPGHAENAASGSARIRVMSANLRYDNAHADRLGAQIQSANPDVLVLLELTPLTLAKVAST